MKKGELEIFLKVKRQDGPDGISYWERFEFSVPAETTVLSLISKISEEPVTDEGEPSTHVCVESSCGRGLCGSCAMLINGRPMLACKTMVADLDSRITVEPLAKFPIVRDLVIDRSSICGALLDHELWSGCESLPPDGGGPDFARFDAGRQRLSASFMDCLMCGACVEVCPSANPRSKFPGAWLFGVMLGMSLNCADLSAVRKMKRSAAGPDGLSQCEGVGNCSEFCPMGLRLSDAMGIAGFEAATQSLIDFIREES